MGDHQQLFKAARSGDTAKINDLETKHAGILYSTTPQGNTALHMAARAGHIRLVDDIIARHPSLIFKSNHTGETPVHIAARAGSREVVRAFFEFGEKNVCRIRDNQGNTPLHGAARNGHEDVVRLMGPRDTESLLLVNDFQESPLSIALDRKFSRMARLIIYYNPGTLNHRGPNGKTALHYATIRTDLRTMNAILENKGKDLVQQRDDNKRTPLHYAAALGAYEMVACLLHKDFSVAYHEDEEAKIPAHLAAENGHVNVLKALLDFCPDTIESLDHKRQSILHLAAKNGKIDAVSWILEDLPEMEDLVNAPDVDGNTPLHLAAMNFHSGVVYVLSRNPEVEIKAINNHNKTALSLLYSSDDREMEIQKHLTLKALKSAYADRDMKVEDIFKTDLEDIEVEKANRASKKEDISNKELKEIVEKVNQGQKSRELAQTLSVMATLIATFTFTAAFTLPGGFKNSGPEEGMATLLNKWSFQAFIITDTIAMTSSMTAAVIVFWSSSHRNSESFMDILPFAIFLTWIALVAMALAFVTGLFAVLSNMIWLAILVCVVGCAPPAILYIFAPFFLVLFDVLSSFQTSRVGQYKIVEDNPVIFVVRLKQMTYVKPKWLKYVLGWLSEKTNRLTRSSCRTEYGCSTNA